MSNQFAVSNRQNIIFFLLFTVALFAISAFLANLGDISGIISKTKPVLLSQFEQVAGTGEMVTFTIKHPVMVDRPDGLADTSLFELYIVRSDYTRGSKYAYVLYPKPIALRDSDSGLEISFESAAPRFMDEIEKGDIGKLHEKHLQGSLSDITGVSFTRKAVAKNRPLTFLGTLSKAGNGYKLDRPEQTAFGFDAPIVSTKTIDQMVAREHEATQSGASFLYTIVIVAAFVGVAVLIIGLVSAKDPSRKTLDELPEATGRKKR
jgi:hypothetical protein